MLSSCKSYARMGPVSSLSSYACTSFQTNPISQLALTDPEAGPAAQWPNL